MAQRPSRVSFVVSGQSGTRRFSSGKDTKTASRIRLPATSCPSSWTRPFPPRLVGCFHPRADQVPSRHARCGESSGGWQRVVVFGQHARPFAWGRQSPSRNVRDAKSHSCTIPRAVCSGPGSLLLPRNKCPAHRAGTPIPELRSRSSIDMLVAGNMSVRYTSFSRKMT
jgi:hypothetical protein